MRLEGVVNTMSEKDPSTYNEYTSKVIKASKEENASNGKDDYTLIGSTIKTYVKVYKKLGDKWINITDNRVKELGITYKIPENKADLNTMPLITALLQIKEIQETFKTQDEPPGAIPSSVPSGRGPPRLLAVELSQLPATIRKLTTR